MKYLLTLICVFIAFLYSCSESTTDPNNNNPEISKIDYLTNHTWTYKSSENNKLPENMKLIFHRNGELSSFKDSKWIAGTWTIDSSYSNISASNFTKTESFTLISVDAASLVIKALVDGQIITVTYIKETENNPLTISGNITFMPDVPDQDLSKAKVVIVWQSPADEWKGYVWGIGSINVQNKTFSIKVDQDQPMSIFMQNTSKIDGYFNIGYIMLLWDNSITNGKTFDWQDMENVQFGALEDRAILYINGDYKSWDLDFLYQDFEQGFNYCKGWYNTQQGQNDGWQVTPQWNNQYIKVVKEGGFDNFKFPNWS